MSAYDRLLASGGRVPEVGSGRLTSHWALVGRGFDTASWSSVRPSMAGSRIGPRPPRRVLVRGLSCHRHARLAEAPLPLLLRCLRRAPVRDSPDRAPPRPQSPSMLSRAARPPYRDGSRAGLVEGEGPLVVRAGSVALRESLA